MVTGAVGDGIWVSLLPFIWIFVEDAVKSTGGFTQHGMMLGSLSTIPSLRSQCPTQSRAGTPRGSPLPNTSGFLSPEPPSSTAFQDDGPRSAGGDPPGTWLLTQGCCRAPLPMQKLPGAQGRAAAPLAHGSPFPPRPGPAAWCGCP